MKPERWQQIESLFQSALEREPDQRAAFLDQACAGDEELRKEVESLLAYEEKVGNFIETPAMKVAARSLADDDQSKLPTGQLIGPYKILSPLGSGGMAEVYLARDTRLGRKIALKLLPSSFTKDEDRVRRFKQEARAASALNHPNILTIHEIGQIEEINFIATEFIDGETLRQRLKRRKLELGEAIDVAIQVCNALAAAHEEGIVHRDIKPENIMLRPDGYVKVLDFGLAKLTERETRADTEAITIGKIDTDPGIVMGTVNYMSPEQARGHAVDERTDIFSLGVVLYEMVTGRMPFKGETSSHIIVSIMEKEPPPLAEYLPEAPIELQRIVTKALVKDREERYQKIKELLIDLKGLKQQLSDGAGEATNKQSIVETLKQPAIRTGEVATVRSTSSAEYLVSEIGRHRLAFALFVVALLALVGIGYYLHTSNGKAIDSVAVMPFVNVGADPDTEYLSDGIAESLINNLSQLPNLKVMSRSSVFRYKGREIDPKAVGSELKVRAVLTGRVLQRGNGLTISLELVDARDNSQLWGEQYNRKLADILQVQAEISREILENLRLRLSGAQQKQFAKRYTENTEAYQLYLKGRYFWNKRTEESLKKGIEYFKQTIEKDPNYPLAYAGLADSYILLSFFSGAAPEEFFPRAKAAAVRALEIDDTLAEAHTTLAYVKLYSWDWPGAEREFKRAIELNPGYATAHQWYAEYLRLMGRLDESISEVKRALELDPFSLIINTDLGIPYYHARQYDEAIKQFKKVLEMDPNFAPAHYNLGRCYEMVSMFDEAIAEHRKAVELAGDSPIIVAGLGYSYGISGRTAEARGVLGQLIGPAEKRPASPYLIAMVYAGLGEKEQALSWLEKAYKDRDVHLTKLRIDSRMDSLRSDPRYQDLVMRIGLGK